LDKLVAFQFHYNDKLSKSKTVLTTAKELLQKQPLFVYNNETNPYVRRRVPHLIIFQPLLKAKVN
jgi:hypothetical protein